MTGPSPWPAIGSDVTGWFSQAGLVPCGLAPCGLAALALVPIGAIWAVCDNRTIAGERVACKPMRFALSVGVYLLTADWMLGYVQTQRLAAFPARCTVWALAIGAGVELACIVVQAARGLRSHLNLDTPLDAAISMIMLAMALLFIGTALPLAWEIACHPRPGAAPPMIWAIVAGLVTTFALGTLTGMGMGQVASQAPGPADARSKPPGRKRGGTMRLAHFLGIHAMQAFPALAAGLLALPERVAAMILAAGAICYVAATLALWARARPRSASRAGRPRRNVRDTLQVSARR